MGAIAQSDEATIQMEVEAEFLMDEIIRLKDKYVELKLHIEHKRQEIEVEQAQA